MSVGGMRDSDKIRQLTYFVRGSLMYTSTALLGGLEHIKIQTRLIDERFESVMGECVIWKL